MALREVWVVEAKLDGRYVASFIAKPHRARWTAAASRLRIYAAMMEDGAKVIASSDLREIAELLEAIDQSTKGGDQ